MTLVGCSTRYIVEVPNELLEPTTYPSHIPLTWGEAVLSIPEWKAKVDEGNADKAAIKKYIEEMNRGEERGI